MDRRDAGQWGEEEEEEWRAEVKETGLDKENGDKDQRAGWACQGKSQKEKLALNYTKLTQGVHHVYDGKSSTSRGLL